MSIENESYRFFNSSDKFRQKQNKMKDLLDRISKELQNHLKRNFPRYIIRVSRQKGYFYVLVTVPRGNISSDDRDFLFRNIQLISQEIYENYSLNFYEFRFNFFPCFQLLSCSGNNHNRYNFLVVKKH